MEALIRRAHARDVDELVALRWEMSVEERRAEADRDTFAARCAAFTRDALADDRWAIWVAEIGGRLAATTWVYVVPRVPRPWPRDGPWGYVTNVFVRPRDRGGLGTRLLARVVEWATAERLHLLLVWPSERSVSFYTRAGFARSADALELVLVPDEPLSSSSGRVPAEPR